MLLKLPARNVATDLYWQFHQDYYLPRGSSENADESTPSMLTCFNLLFCPLTIITALLDTLNAFANTTVNFLFAAPSTGGAETRTRNAPLCSPATSFREDRGTTYTLNTNRPSRMECSIKYPHLGVKS